MPVNRMHVNAGRPAVVQSLIDRFAGTVRRDDIEMIATPVNVEDVLQKLYSLRAVVSVASE